MCQNRQLVFVYGTLRRGEENHRLLVQETMLGEVVTAREFTMIDLGDYPAVVQYGTYAIVGEVYKIAGDTLAKLDELEEYPEYYQRTIISTRYGDAWMYVLSGMPDGCISPIECGDWVAHKIRKHAKSPQ